MPSAPPTPSIGAIGSADVLCVHPSVAVRPEPFGALVYHYGNRRLVFLKAPSMVRLLDALDGRRTVDEALAAAEVPPADWAGHRDALASLMRSDLVVTAGGA